MSQIGDRIRSRRKELKLTQLNIKEKTGISSGNLSDIENGNKLPSSIALISLSNVLDCSIDWILKGDSFSPLCENDHLLLDLFHQLPSDEQVEIIDIINLKLAKHKRNSPIPKKASSSPSESSSDLKMA